MRNRFWQKALLAASGVLVVVAIVMSIVAWCVSDSGMSWIQRHFMNGHGNLTWHSLSLSYGNDWVVENVSRPEDGAVLIYGFWKSGKTFSASDVSLVLKRRDTGERVSFVMGSIASDRAKPANYDECLRTAKCRIGQSFLGLVTPNVIVTVDGGEWVVLDRFATSVLVLNPSHVNLGDIRLQSTMPPHK